MSNANAAKHDEFYPRGEEISPILAYGFRPFFLILPWYIALISLLWGLGFSGVIPLPPFSDPLLWHIYELLFGVGFAGIAAFLLTGVPELFPGAVPLVGRKLKWLVIFWILGRVSFWCMGILSPYPAMIFNLGFSLYIIFWCFHPVITDPLQRHASLGYAIAGITLLQALFFASILGFSDVGAITWLYCALHGFIVLILLALRRVQTEAINESMEQQGIEDLFIARPFRYNLAIFCVAIFGVLEFLEISSTAGWVAFAASCAILGIINDFRLKFEGILHLPYVILFALLFVIISAGYALFGVGYLFELPFLSYARHVLTIGAFGGAFLAVMVVVGFVHTGRKVGFDLPIFLASLALFCALVARLASGLPFAFVISAGFFALSFLIYFYRFQRYLRTPRPDGLPG